jgi:tetraacyldisaccharide 4'-kinase
MKDPNNFWIFLTFPFRWLYLAGILFSKLCKKKRFPTCLTVCIGNITVGGNGKTPFLLKLLQDLQDLHPIVLSKGYKRNSIGEKEVFSSSTVEEVGDECLLIKKKFPKAKVFVCDSREEFLSKRQKALFLLDDGFQDRKGIWDLSVLLFDQSLFSKKQYLLPTGVLRQKFIATHNADFIGIKGMMSEEKFRQIEKRFRSKKIHLPLFSFYLQPQAIVPLSQGIFHPKLKTAIFSGIGNPSSFKETLKEFNVEFDRELILLDHEKFDEEEFYQWMQECKSLNIQQILCTKKDAIKLTSVQNFILPVFFLETDVVIQHGQIAYELFLKKIKAKWATIKA